MATDRKLYTYNELVEQIKHCGQSIIDNADSILGNERYFLNLEVSFQIFRSKSQFPTVQVKRDFTPELEMEDYETYRELKIRKYKKDGTNI